MDGYHYTALFEAPNGKPVLKVYPDPKTNNAPFTVGLGHTGPDVHEGDTWAEERCWHAFYSDYARAQGEAIQTIGASCWAGLSEPRRAVLTDMAFHMGGHGLAGFQHMLTAIRAKNWSEASAEMKDSQYHKDTPSRCEKNASVMVSGEWP